MRFLADECFDARLVVALREQGHDVFAVREHAPGAGDDAVLDLAHAQRRVLLTEDTDFGELVYRLQRPAAGVILLRLGDVPLSVKRDRLHGMLRRPERALGQFVVVETHRVRVRPLPAPPIE